MVAAAGGIAEGDAGQRGGKGGAGATLAGEKPPVATTLSDNQGGGGGGVGRIRINSASPPSLLGTLSPATPSAAVTLGPLPTAPLP
jgi:hypothetical protein